MSEHRSDDAIEPEIVDAKVIRYKTGDDTRSVVSKATAPFDLVEFRERIIAASGVTAEELGETLRDALEQLKRGIHATKVTYHTYQGEVVSESVDVDWRAVYKAIEVLRDTFGVAPTPRNTHDPAIVTSVTVNVASWFEDDAE